MHYTINQYDEYSTTYINRKANINSMGYIENLYTKLSPYDFSKNTRWKTAIAPIKYVIGNKNTSIRDEYELTYFFFMIGICLKEDFLIYKEYLTENSIKLKKDVETVIESVNNQIDRIKNWNR